MEAVDYDLIVYIIVFPRELLLQPEKGDLVGFVFSDL